MRTDMVVAQTLLIIQQQLCGVTGHCMPLKGPEEVCVKVSSVEEKLPVYIADMEEPCLLGLDYLMQNEACQQAFEDLKQALVETPVLPCPDPSNRYLLDTDASAESVGAVLSQVREGQEHVVTYYSAKFSQPERNYCITRKEFLAVVKSLEHFHSSL